MPQTPIATTASGSKDHECGSLAPGTRRAIEAHGFRRSHGSYLACLRPIATLRLASSATVNSRWGRQLAGHGHGHGQDSTGTGRGGVGCRRHRRRWQAGKWGGVGCWRHRRCWQAGSGDTTAVGTGSSGVDVHRSWRWATGGKVQSIFVGLWGDVERHWINPLASAVSVSKCKVCTSAHRSVRNARARGAAVKKF